MSDLLFEKVIVSARDGSGIERQANQPVCSCGSRAFIIFDIGGHQHLQCFCCETTYCDGRCGSPAVKEVVQ